MPTILVINGWRFFFFANEGNEPIHIHGKNAEKNCKYWINVETHMRLTSPNIIKMNT